MHNEHDTETASMIHKRICERAYEIWMERGCSDGSAEEDWYKAESEINGPKVIADTPESPFLHTAVA